MKKIKFKRIAALMLSLAMCCSFCLINSNAYWVDYSTNPTECPLNSGSACGWVSISNWANGEPYDTDLEARTYVRPTDYDDETYVTSRAYVSLTVTLEEYSSDSTWNSAPANDYNAFNSVVFGRVLLNYDDPYSIIGFTSCHKVYVTRNTVFDFLADAWDTPVESQDGWTGYIGTSS